MSDSPRRLDTAATRLSRSTPLYDQARASDAGRALTRVAEARRARHRALAAWPDVTASIDLRERSGDDPIDLDGADQSLDLDAAETGRDEPAAPADGQALARPDDGTAALAVGPVPDVVEPVVVVPVVVVPVVVVPVVVVPVVVEPVAVMPEPVPGPDPVPSPSTPPVPSPVTQPAPAPSPAGQPVPVLQPVPVTQPAPVVVATRQTVGLQLVVRRPAAPQPDDRLERVRAALRAEQPQRALVVRLPEADPAWALALPEVVHAEEPVIDLRDPAPPAVFDDADRFLAHLLETH